MKQRQEMNDQQHSEELDRLFRAYRSACPDPEPSASFMPGLWARIDARRRPMNLYGAFSRRILAGAAVLSLAMAILLFRPFAAPALPVANNAYLEALADDHQENLIELEATPGSGEIR